MAILEGSRFQKSRFTRQDGPWRFFGRLCPHHVLAALFGLFPMMAGAAGRVTGSVRSGLFRTPETAPGDPAGWLRVGVVPNKRLLLVRKGRRMVVRRKLHTVIVYAASVLDPNVRDGVSIRVETS